ncbi:transcriptional regulator [Rhodococcus sp. HNM0569]|uniref:transcriptional regulator n=1 Tax=Rhodococcus sp. HNM0569 TaxID=2716340 RepID=UPI001F1027AD|nr:transcriptional regulator [Rhodococcus sp. HNM0569]
MQTGISSGGSGLSADSAHTRELAAAARARDVVGIRRVVEGRVVEHGVARAWAHTVQPLLDAARTPGLQDVDVALLAEALGGVFATLTVDAPIGTGPAVLLSTVPGRAPVTGPAAVEFHALAAALARVPVNLRVTAPVSRSALGATLAGSAADVVALWWAAHTEDADTCTDTDAADVASLVPWLRRRRRGVTIVAGGPGARPGSQGLPRSVRGFGDVTSAVECIVEAVRTR